METDTHHHQELERLKTS